MQVIGFRQLEDYTKDSIYSQQERSRIDLSIDDVKRVVSYLEEGAYVIGFLEAVVDGDVVVGGYSILTDGEWMWPSHFSYFLNKKATHEGTENIIDKAFWEHVVSNNFIIPVLDSESMEDAHGFFWNDVNRTDDLSI